MILTNEPNAVPLNLTDLNRFRRIGASSTLLELGDFRILIDAGLDPKEVGPGTLPDYSLLGDAPLDLILLTHCHLDHLGSLPLVARRHPEATILCSRASQYLATRMLRNSYNVMKRQREELNIPEYPLYNKSDLDALEQTITGIPFSQTRTYGHGRQELDITLYPSGHVAGAAGIKLTHKHRNIFITGDVLFASQHTLPGARFPEEDFDTIIMETTRGRADRHPEMGRESETTRLIKTLRDTLSHGGSVLIPSFALGRMQEILVLLHKHQVAGELPVCPVFCSGLGLDLVDYFDVISRKTGAVNFRRSILRDLGVKTIRKLPPPGGNLPEQGIYVLSSGMLVEHTPSYHTAAAMLPNPSNAICFVGYCDPDTPGGRLLRSAHDENFMFETLDYVCRIRANINQFDLSGHADREELIDYALARNPRAVVLTHGDPEAREWFDQEFAMRAPNIKVTDPTPGQRHLI